jgi:hypothetical protein
VYLRFSSVLLFFSLFLAVVQALGNPADGQLSGTLRFDPIVTNSSGLFVAKLRKLPTAATLDWSGIVFEPE